MGLTQGAMIIGAGGHSRVIISILKELHSYDIRGILDLEQPNSEESIMGIPVLGSVELLTKLDFVIDLNFFLAIGSNSIRRHWFERLSNQRLKMPNLISPHAIVDSAAQLGHANVICARAFIGPQVAIQSNNLFNTGSIIEHEARVGNHCHFAPASSISGRVVVGDECFIGAGATILEGVSLEGKVTVGGGALINKDLKISGASYVGVPGKILAKGG